MGPVYIFDWNGRWFLAVNEKGHQLSHFWKILRQKSNALLFFEFYFY